MEDKIRNEWIRKVETVESHIENVIDSSRKRQHKSYAMNVTMKPIIIAGIGNDYEEDGIRIKKTIQFGVLGEDARHTGIQDIRKFSDKELDESRSYQDFLRKGYIKEIDDNEARYRMEQASMHLQRMRQGGTMPRIHVFEKQRPANPYYTPEFAQYYEQVQKIQLNKLTLAGKKHMQANMKIGHHSMIHRLNLTK
jgi:hypothetical protein